MIANDAIPPGKKLSPKPALHTDRPTDRPDRQFVDALARGLSILECLSKAQKPLGNGELAQQLMLAPSTVSRLLHTLTELGYLRRCTQGRRYELTPKNLTLGYPLLTGMQLRDRVMPHLQTLCARSGQTVALAVPDDLFVCFVDVVQGSAPQAIRLATGGRLPMAVSAAGVAILAASADRRRWSMLHRLRGEIGLRGDSFEVFEQLLANCNKLGYAVVRNTWRNGVGGIAVALRWQNTLAALTLPVCTTRISARRMHEELAPMLLAAATVISSDAGKAG